MFIKFSLFAIKIESSSHAVDVAGEQRMLSQRMLKNYAMIGMNNTFGDPKKDLQNVINDFENHMESLYQYTDDEITKNSLNDAKKLWIPIKKMLNDKPTKEDAKKLQEDLDILLKAADKSTKLFSKLTGKKSGEIIDISGRQRMLSQRMASLYMLKVWGVQDPKFTQKMDEAMKLFKTSLNKLIAYDKNTPEIATLLNQAKKSFMFFEFMNRSKSKFIPSLIYKKSNDILNDMNSATKLYTKIEA